MNFFESAKGYRFMEVEIPRLTTALEEMVVQLKENNELLRENNRLLKEDKEKGEV